MSAPERRNEESDCMSPQVREALEALLALGEHRRSIKEENEREQRVLNRPRPELADK